MVEGELEHELGRRRDPQLAPGKRRHQVQVLLDRLEHRVRIELDVAHDGGEHVPLDLCERQKQVFVGQQRMLATARLFDGAVDDALRGLPDLAWRDVEIFYLHGCLPRLATSKTHASDQRRRAGAPHRYKRLSTNELSRNADGQGPRAWLEDHTWKRRSFRYFKRFLDGREIYRRAGLSNVWTRVSVGGWGLKIAKDDTRNRGRSGD